MARHACGMVLGLCVLMSLGACSRRTRSEPTPPQPSSGPRSTQLRLNPNRPLTAAPASLATIRFPLFLDVHEAAGIHFRFDNGDDARQLMVLSTAGGCGWLDYDNDGHWDLFVAQGGDPAPPPERENERPLDRLYRNRGDGTFEDVTEFTGCRDRGFSHGIAVGDFDDDGFDDVLVTNVGRNTLYRNQGDGTFQDVTIPSGIGDRAVWSASAAWADLDQDGYLDLYVCNYVKYDPYHPTPCPNPDGSPGVCIPFVVPGETNDCYFNNGDGTFRQADPQASGLIDPGGKSLGVAIADFNNDGLPDIFVANDVTPNYLFVNQGHGKFLESALLLGCALGRNGRAQANMGVAVGDYDHRGLLDIYITHFTDDNDTLYANLGEKGFWDVTQATGLPRPSVEKLGFGAVLADFNQDGQEDLFVTNGHIADWRDRGEAWKMRPQLFSFDGRIWRNGSDQGGAIFQQEFLGRAVATCDYDDDGDLDLAVIHQNDPLALLRNDSQRGHWLKLRFIGRTSNRRGVGTRVTLTQGNKRLMQELAGGTSYCASHQPVLIFGLGDDTRPCNLQVRWPLGTVQEIRDLRVDQSRVLEEPRVRRPM
ncbi:MAG: CRTAC1 family protein, partial [Planctomycetota bacterium]|nr:CRTAC1 family protein [Planctomycetota bacterium]